jgi:hypothetical protein
VSAAERSGITSHPDGTDLLAAIDTGCNTVVKTGNPNVLWALPVVLPAASHVGSIRKTPEITDVFDGRIE